MKRVLSLLFLVGSITSCSRSTPSDIAWIPFDWVRDSIPGRAVEKAYINVPVTIDGLPHEFTMQFDLGAVITMLYGNPAEPFLDKYPSLANKLDTTFRFRVDGYRNPKFRGVNLRLGEVPFDGRDVGLYRDYGDEPAAGAMDSGEAVHIGTIAPDLFQDRVLIIDYPGQRLAAADSIPAEYRDAAFEDFRIDGGGRIYIPFDINGTKEELMFDTGTSIFTLLTSEENAREIGGEGIVDSMSVPSWGSYLSVYGLKTVAPVTFGGRKMDDSVVYYMEDMSWLDAWGITGNAYFLNNVVILDYRNRRFGVK